MIKTFISFVLNLVHLSCNIYKTRPCFIGYELRYKPKASIFVAKNNGDDFPAKSLYAIVCKINRSRETKIDDMNNLNISERRNKRSVMQLQLDNNYVLWGISN